jgi:hypothetical protein
MKEIDSYGIIKPDVKGIVRFVIPSIRQTVFETLKLEVVSKPQIRFKGKAQADRESAAYIGM